MSRKKNPNTEELLLLGGAGLLLWWYFTKSSTTTTTTTSTPTGTTSVLSTAPPSTTPVTTTPPVTTGGTTGTTGGSTTPPTPAPYSVTMAAIQTAAAAGGLSTTGTASPDQWNYFAAQVIPGFTPPAPESLFPSSVTATVNNSHAPVSFSTWWNAFVPFLPSGLSGFGLGMFGMGALYPYGGWRGKGWAA